MTPEQELDAFEAWLEKDYNYDDLNSFEINMARDAWQARAALQPDWEPIETAPKNGHTLLLGYFNSNGNWRTMRGQWISQDYIDNYFEDDWADADPGWYETVVESDDLPNCWLIDPTHWMPIPPPPTKEQS
jgi:hypothetical protein